MMLTLLALCLAADAPAPPRADTFATTLDEHVMEVRIALGWQQGVTQSTGFGISANNIATFSQFAWGLTDRVQLTVPALAYRFGTRGSFELVPWGGFTSLGFGYSTVEDAVVSFSPAAGAGARFWLQPNHALNATAALSSFAQYSKLRQFDPVRWRSEVTAGYSGLLDVVQLNIGVGYSQLAFNGSNGPHGFGSAYSQPVLSFGSVQSLGGRRLPLIAARLTDAFSLEAHVTIAISPAAGTVAVEALLGCSWVF